LFVPRLLGYEGVEVINPYGKKEVKEEAQKGRWKNVFIYLFSLVL